MPKEEQIARLWTRESILDVENKILQQVMSARTPEGAQASIAFSRFLNGLFDLIFKGKRIEGFYLGSWLRDGGLLRVLPPQDDANQGYVFLPYDHRR